MNMEANETLSFNSIWNESKTCYQMVFNDIHLRLVELPGSFKR